LFGGGGGVREPKIRGERREGVERTPTDRYDDATTTHQDGGRRTTPGRKPIKTTARGERRHEKWRDPIS